MAWTRFAVPVAVMLLLTAPAARARQNPEPPPSGIVVHLFGPGSVTSNILPTVPGASALGASALGASAPGASTPGAAAPGYVELSAGEVLHQMFVTGDPDEPATAKLPKGRPGEQD